MLYDSQAARRMNRALYAIRKSIPFRKQLQALKRVLLPYTSDPANDRRLLDEATHMVAAMRDIGATIHGAVIVEIGTGWLPILPLILRAGGAGEVITLDHDRLMDRRTFVHAITYIRENLDRILRISGLPRSYFNLSTLPSRSEPSLADLCRAGAIVYRAPFDFTKLAPQSADMVVSRATLEHIPEQRLREIFLHAAKVVKPGGIMCHIVDVSDHFAHTDKSLSRVDMLRYSDEEWLARTRHRLNHLSRLRWFDYAGLMRDTGWDVLRAWTSSDEAWDAYEESYLDGVERYALERPDDPDVPAMLKRIRAWHHAYQFFGRFNLGFGLYLLKR